MIDGLTVKEVLDSTSITQPATTNKKISRLKVFDRNVGQREKLKRIGTDWSDEEREEPFSDRIELV